MRKPGNAGLSLVPALDFHIFEQRLTIGVFMQIKFPNSAQVNEILAAQLSFECPEPDKATFESKFNGSVSLGEALSFANDQLCSGLYLAALLLAKSNDPGEYTSNGDLSDFLIEGSEVALVIGNLTVKGDLTVGFPLIVTGNLNVEGCYEDAGSESPVAVLGNLSCQNMYTTAWVIVGGNTKVEHFFYGYYNDDSFECNGTLSASAILTDEHQILPGRFEVKHVPPGGSLTDKEVFDLRKSADALYLHGLYNENLAKVISEDKLLDYIDE